MATIGSLVVDLQTRTAKFQQGMDQANRKLSGFQNSVNRASRVLGTFGVALGGAALARFGRNVITTTAALEDAARTAGIGVERFQELTKAFADLGGIAEKTTGEAFRRFNRRLGLAQQGSGEAAKTFEQLGITLTSGTGVALEQTIQRLAGIQDAAARSAAASQVFGEDAGPRLAAVLGMGTKAINDQIKRLRAQGRVLGEDNVKAAGALDDTLSELSDTMNTQLSRAVTDNADEFDRLARTLQSDAFQDGLAATVGLFTSMAEALAESAAEMGSLTNAIKNADFGDIGRFLASRTGPGFLLDKLGMADLSIGDDSGSAPDAPKRNKPSVITGGAGSTIVADGKSLDDFTDKLRTHNRELRAELGGWSALEEQMQAVEEASKTLGRQLTQEETEAVRNLVTQRQNLSKAIKDNNDKLDDQKQRADELGYAFNSAFEDAAVEGEKFRDVLRGLAADLAKIAIRESVTEPFIKPLGSSIGGFFGSLFGGARASGGPVSAGRAYLVGEQGPELFMPNTSGGIVPNGKMGGSTFAPVYNIDARGADAGAVSRIERVLKEDARTRKQQVQGIVSDLVRRNQLAI